MLAKGYDDGTYYWRVAIIDGGRIVALDAPGNLKGMIGAETITLEAEKGGEALIAALRSFDWIRSASSSNGTIELQVDHAQSRIPEVMLQAVRNDAVIRSVGLHEPTLEDVFVALTGRHLRDE